MGIGLLSRSSTNTDQVAYLGTYRVLWEIILEELFKQFPYSDCSSFGFHLLLKGGSIPGPMEGL